MRRLFTAFCVLSLFAMQMLGHGDDSHFANQQEVTVKTTKITGNVYMLQGRGGNIGVITGMDGILIVDDDYKAVSAKLAEALKALGSEKPRFVFNTHWHGDHTEGNEFFGKDSIIVAHVNVRKRLLDPPTIFGNRPAVYPSFAMPIVTYTESLSIHINGDEIRAVHFPNGHTDGDTVVFFKNANVVHLGDDFFVGRFPFVDLASGGSVQGLINNIAELIRQIPADAKLIPGHGPLSTIEDLKAYHQTLIETSKFVQDEMKKGKSLDDMKKAGLPEKYKEWGSGFIKTDFWIETVYNSYSKK
ncbi:MAG TPA: MBL fold metallo-hydrolase [Pyrinomonadaceae bacterium]|nr:MBL fold metallo-hydrolase [Pyrinomonadaceae bacterium]